MQIRVRAALARPYALILGFALAAEPAGAAVLQADTVRVSVGPGGLQANGFSSDIARNRPSVSGDGRFVAFESQASNLVAGDTNGTSDIFVHELATGLTTRVSIGSGGVQANADCLAPEITPDGRFVLFTSGANNLVPGEANNSEDVFLHDRAAGTTVCVSVTPAGTTGAGSSGPGAHDSFYRRPLTADGRLVAFASNAGNLVANDTNFFTDVFVRDLLTGTTARVSVDAGGAQVNGASTSPSITPDGRFVAFESTAPSLVPGDVNGTTDIFVKDLQTGTVVLASKNAAGAQGNFLSREPSISSDGRVVAFLSHATNLVPGDTNALADVFVKSLDTGAVVRANLRHDGTEPTVPADGPMLSRDGRFVAFGSWDPMLVPGDTNGVPDVFARDLVLGVPRRVGLGAGGSEPNGRVQFPDLTSNGLAFAFSSPATNLVPGDTNGKDDVFVHDLPLAGPTVFCLAKPNSLGCLPSIHCAGTPTASPGFFVIGASNVLNNKPGILLYGFAPAATPFMGGVLCIAPPVRRTPPQGSLGNPPPNDCSGSYSFDMNAFITSGANPALLPGARVVAQYWSRDPGSPSGAVLSDALAFTIL